MASSSPSTPDAPRVLIVGGEGLVGQELQRQFVAGHFPIASMETWTLAEAEAFGADASAAAPNAELVFLAVQEGLARELAPRLCCSARLVFDFSPAFRLDPAVPLLAMPRPAPWPSHGLVALPNCTNPALLQVLTALREVGRGLKRVRVVGLQAASGGGRRLRQETLAGGPLQGDLWPVIGSVLEDGASEEEHAVADELRRLLADPALDLSAHCLRVPVDRGHGFSLEVVTAIPLTPAQAQAALAALPRLELHAQGPTPKTLPDRAVAHLGRLRQVSPAHPERGLTMWLVADNLDHGAASHALEVARRCWEAGRGD